MPSDSFNDNESKIIDVWSIIEKYWFSITNTKFHIVSDKLLKNFILFHLNIELK